MSTRNGKIISVLETCAYVTSGDLAKCCNVIFANKTLCPVNPRIMGSILSAQN